MSTPTSTATGTVSIEPLVKIEGVPKVHPDVPQNVKVFEATCRDCGPLNMLSDYPTMTHASLVQKRHLAEHLTALAAEIALATR